MDYKEAKEILDNKHGDKSTKKVANNTYLKRYEDGVIALRLHQTDIIQYKPNGTIILNSGGWKTVTTKARMNEYLPRQYGILQEKGVWYVALSNGYNKDMLYSDGMKLTKNTKPTNLKVVKAREKRNKREVEQINKYADRYIEALFNGKVPAPSGADCWHCSMMYDKDKNDPEHFKKHLDEMYFVPSLLYHALEETGSSNMVRGVVGSIWQEEEPTNIHVMYKDLAREQIKISLVRFMKRKVGIAN